MCAFLYSAALQAGRFWPRFNRNFLEKRARSYIAGGLVDSWFGAHPTSCVNTAAGAVMKWECECGRRAA